MLEAISFKDNKLRILNQLKLPLSEEYLDVCGVNDAWQAIRLMQVRGAPAIAMVGILSVAVDINSDHVRNTIKSDKSKLVDHIKSLCDHICTARPTAVNIKKECHALMVLCEELCKNSNVNIDNMISEITNYSGNLLKNDVSVNCSIGDFGAKHIIAENENNQSINVLTHCNTGSLATAGYGTALGVVRSLHKMGKLSHAYCTETRPYNQGSRLTSWELVHDKIPATLICDSMVGALMREKPINAVIVGADRVVENGDTANKIGTYQIAVCAKYHNVPFYVACPTSTIDAHLKNGSAIPIEERPPDEMKFIGGIQIATSEINCWNPSFDVTPADLITGIITEFGVFKPSEFKEKCINQIMKLNN